MSSAPENVVWEAAVPGKGWSSPVVVSGRVYLTTAVERGRRDGHSLRAFALDAKSGKKLWDVEVFGLERNARIHPKNSHASPTPVVDDGKIFVHFGPHGTACLDTDGKVAAVISGFRPGNADKLADKARQIISEAIRIN